MKATKLLTAAVLLGCALGLLLASNAFAISCCTKAAAAGKKCTHPCCVAAAKEGKVCEKCNPPKKEKK